jgi:hypothetical protein
VCSRLNALLSRRVELGRLARERDRTRVREENDNNNSVGRLAAVVRRFRGQSHDDMCSERSTAGGQLIKEKAAHGNGQCPRERQKISTGLLVATSPSRPQRQCVIIGRKSRGDNVDQMQ